MAKTDDNIWSRLLTVGIFVGAVLYVAWVLHIFISYHEEAYMRELIGDYSGMEYVEKPDMYAESRRTYSGDSHRVSLHSSNSSTLFRHRPSSGIPYSGRYTYTPTYDVAGQYGSNSTYGVYTTSSASVRSYGGGATASGSSGGSSSQSSTSIPLLSESGSSSVSVHALSLFSPLYHSYAEYTSSGVSAAEGKAIVMSAISSSSSSWGSFPMSRSRQYTPFPYQSAEAYLDGVSVSLSDRRGASTPSIYDDFIRWLETEWPDGNHNLTIEDLEELYNKMNPSDFENDEGREAFVTWFIDQENEKWCLPVGDGTWVLLVLAAGYLGWHCCWHKLRC